MEIIDFEQRVSQKIRLNSAMPGFPQREDFGVTKEDAGAFALVVHTTQTVWTTAVGFVAIGLLPFVNKKYDRIKQSNN